MKHYEPVGLKMGQVDCIAQGDLCIRLNVDYYPQIKLFEDGKFIESYSSVFVFLTLLKARDSVVLSTCSRSNAALIHTTLFYILRW